jgi:hypothetical protein
MMKKAIHLLTTLLATSVMMTGCALWETKDASASGSVAFDDLVKPALEKNAVQAKAGYAWTSTAIKNKYGNEHSEEGKAFKASGYKLSLVEATIFEGEQALKKGDEATALKKAKHAVELVDAQEQQKEISSDYKILWK